MLKWPHAAGYGNIRKLTDKQWDISSLTKIAIVENVTVNLRKGIEKAWITIDLGGKKIISDEH